METKHTPLEIEEEFFYPPLNGGFIRLSNGISLGFSKLHPFKTQPEALTYANHLIKCVNNNERLVEMVEKMVERLGEEAGFIQDLNLPCNSSIDLIQQATQLLTDLKK